MSSEAIDKRLRTVSQLHRLGKELKRARYLGKVTDLKSDLQLPRAEVERRRSGDGGPGTP